MLGVASHEPRFPFNNLPSGTRPEGRRQKCQPRRIRLVTPAAKAPAGDGAGLGLIPWPKVDFAKFGPIERKELGRIQKISGANLPIRFV